VTTYQSNLPERDGDGFPARSWDEAMAAERDQELRDRALLFRPGSPWTEAQRQHALTCRFLHCGAPRCKALDEAGKDVA
jgi:hypothetical protein